MANKINSTLLLFTCEFPFGVREVFLESEILVLSKHFSSIVIVPSRSAMGLRPLPNNVRIEPFLINERKRLHPKLRILVKWNFYATILKNLRKVKLNKTLRLIRYSFTLQHYKTVLKEILEQYQGDLFYFYWFNASADAMLSLINSGKKDQKVVCRTHRGDLYEEESPLGIFIDRKIHLKTVAKLITISEDGRRYLQHKYSFNNIEVHRLGVFNNYYIPTKFTSKIITVVSVSNLIPVKRVELIAETLILFCKNNSSLTVKWHHFGSGPQREKLIKTITQSSQVNLSFQIHGQVPNRELFSFYEKSMVDVFINLSSSEGVPVSMMEAISFGIPVLATEVGGVSEIVGDETGVLVSPDSDIDVISKALAILISKKLDRHKIQKYWKDNFEASKNYSQFSNCLKSLNEAT